ncbi:hypothetical protein B5S31_g367 [[Candida] boidinii]|nr:hypothetical protein B5S29_g3143 [[Candida] boidinii]OWB70688.1 hypothetical protein B5S31_g367 [[Candida] boidinii]OWB76259.1 hypothetical protein B5S32_g409 [[Candida] boidinii]
MSYSRNVSPMEEFFRWRNIYETYSGYMMYGEFSTEFTVPALYKILENMIYKHPEMYCQFFDKTEEEAKSNPKELKYSWDYILLRILTASSFKKGPEAKISVLTSFNMEDVVEFIEVPDIDTEQGLIKYITENVINDNFHYNNQKPLWKLTVINRKNIIFYSDHTFFDGNSGINLFRELKDEFNELYKTGEIAKLLSKDKETEEKIMKSEIFSSVDAKQEILLPLDNFKICPYTPSNKDFWGIILSAFLPEFMKKLIKLFFAKVIFKFLKPNKFISNRACSNVFWKEDENKPRVWIDDIKFLNYSPEKVNKLVEICRRNGVKLTSLISTACAMGIAPYADNKDIRIGIPINGRKLVNPELLKNNLIKDPLKLFGVIIGEITPVFPSKVLNDSVDAVDEANGQEVELKNRTRVDWDIVRWFQNELNTNGDDSFGGIGMLDYINIQEFVQETLGKPKHVTLELSNVGVVKNNKDDPVKLNQIYFQQPNGVNGGYHGCNVISTDIGGMNISLCTIPGYKKEFETFYKIFDATLERVIALG